MLKYIGIALVFAAALIPVLDFRKRGERASLEYDCLLELIGIIEKNLRYMRPVGEAVRSYSSPSASHIFAEGGAGELLSSPRSVIDRLSVSPEVRCELIGYFTRLGVGTQAEELSRASSMRELLSAARSADRESHRTALRVRTAVCLFFGLTLVIILI